MLNSRRRAWLGAAYAAPTAVMVILFFGVPLVLVAWNSPTPSNDRDWQTEVAVLPHATINGDLVTVHNIRNFDYRSETDFTPQCCNTATPVFVRRECPNGAHRSCATLGFGCGVPQLQGEGKVIMNFGGMSARRHGVRVGVGCLLGGVAAAMVSMPSAAAAPGQCDADQLAGTG